MNLNKWITLKIIYKFIQPLEILSHHQKISNSQNNIFLKSSIFVLNFTIYLFTIPVKRASTCQNLVIIFLIIFFLWYLIFLLIFLRNFCILIFEIKKFFFKLDIKKIFFEISWAYKSEITSTIYTVVKAVKIFTALALTINNFILKIKLFASIVNYFEL